MRIREPRAVMNVRDLPDVAFGPRDIMWWGTLGFVVIEGWTLALCMVAWVYLQQNVAAWPPEGTRLPSLLLPSIELALMLASLPAALWCKRIVRRYDLAKARIAFMFMGVLGLVLTGLQVAVMLVSLNVKWDSNAYGSAQWLVLTYHASLVLVEACEVAGLALAYWFAPVEDKHFPDGADAMFYWVFMVVSFSAVYVLCFLVPRWI
jgi:Heme/copper-type cytochrome/quinol oxidase, subunit 3